MSLESSISSFIISKEHNPADVVIDLGHGVKIGGNNPPIIMGGPCSIESEEQIIETAKEVKKAGAHVLRGGAFKPRTHPYSFQGIGNKGVYFLAEAGKKYNMPTDTEAVGEGFINLVAKNISIIHIGARNGKAFELLKKAGKAAKENKKCVLLKREESATIYEFIGAAEYIANEGCKDIILCLRGIRTYESIENGDRRYTSDLDSIPVLRRLVNLPIMYDPSHASGNRLYVRDLCRGAIALGAHGLMVETHLNPDQAKSDAPQQVTPKVLSEIVKDTSIIYNTLKNRMT